MSEDEYIQTVRFLPNNPFDSVVYPPIKTKQKIRRILMNNVFLCNPSKKIIKGLTDTNFKLSTFSCNNNPGVLIHADEHEVEGQLSKLLTKQETINKQNTDLEGIVEYRIVKKSVEGVTVTCKGNNYNCFESTIKKITSDVLMPVLNKNIIIENVGGKKTPPKDKEAFYIYIYSSPISEVIHSHASRYYNRLPGSYPIFSTSKKGIPVKDWVTGEDIFEVVANVLYIHINLVAMNSSSHDMEYVYKTILEEFILYFLTTSKKRETILKHRQKEKTKESKKEYTELVGKQRVIALNKAKKELVKTDDLIKQYQKSLIISIRKTASLNEHILSMTKGKNNHLKAAQKEYAKIISMPKIKSITFDNDLMIVNTKTLYCTDPRSDILHEIGEFNITIHINPETAPGSSVGHIVSFFNLTGRIYGYSGNKMNAPHVFPSGKPCLGSLTGILTEQIANYQFSIAVMLAIQFLESVNVKDEAGSYINNWPKVKVAEQPEKHQKKNDPQPVAVVI